MSEVGVIVTGAAGFIGKAFSNSLIGHGYKVIGVGRTSCDFKVHRFFGYIRVADLWLEESIDNVFSFIESSSDVNVECLVHFAENPNSHATYTQLETLHYLDVLRKFICRASDAGIKRFIYISSANVMHNKRMGSVRAFSVENYDKKLSYTDRKLATEAMVRQATRAVGMDFVIIRPALVIGPGTTGKFRELTKWISRGLPIIRSRGEQPKPIIGIRNLVAFITLCITRHDAVNRIFTVREPEALTVTALANKIAILLKIRLIHITLPTSIFYVARILPLLRRWLDTPDPSTVADVPDNEPPLGWTPNHSIEDELSLMLRDLGYLTSDNND